LSALEQALAQLERSLHQPATVWRLQSIVYRGLAGYCARRALEGDDGGEDKPPFEDIFDPNQAPEPPPAACPRREPQPRHVCSVCACAPRRRKVYAGFLLRRSSAPCSTGRQGGSVGLTRWG